MDLAVVICTRIAEGKPLTAVCKQKGMPGLSTVYKWRGLHVEFDHMLLRARDDQADTMAWQVVDIADEKCPDAVAVQRNRLRMDARRWLASKMAPKRFGDTLAIGQAPELPPLQMNPVEGAKAIAFVLARAGQLLDQRPGGPANEPYLSAAEAREVLLPAEQLAMLARMTPAPSGEAVDFDVEESEAEMGRIGDPRRVQPSSEAGRVPLSTRSFDRPT
jgi:hypothetical protein